MQRRVYDALNVLSAMDIIYKDKYNIIYNHQNDHIPIDFPVSSHTLTLQEEEPQDWATDQKYSRTTTAEPKVTAQIVEGLETGLL